MFAKCTLHNENKKNDNPTADNTHPCNCMTLGVQITIDTMIACIQRDVNRLWRITRLGVVCLTIAWTIRPKGAADTVM